MVKSNDTPTAREIKRRVERYKIEKRDSARSGTELNEVIRRGVLITARKMILMIRTRRGIYRVHEISCSKRSDRDWRRQNDEVESSSQ